MPVQLTQNWVGGKNLAFSGETAAVNMQETVGWFLFLGIFVVYGIREAILYVWRMRNGYADLRLEHKKRMDDNAAYIVSLESTIRRLTNENEDLRVGTLVNPATGEHVQRPVSRSGRPEGEDRDFLLYREFKAHYGDTLEHLIRHSARIVENAPEVSALNVMCSLDLPMLSQEALASYLDSLEANVAIVQGLTPERPLEVVVRHEDGEWKLLNDGFHRLVLIDGLLSGVPGPEVQGVNRPDQPITRARPRFGAHVARQVGE